MVFDLAKSKKICEHVCAPFSEVTDAHVALAMGEYWKICSGFSTLPHAPLAVPASVELGLEPGPTESMTSPPPAPGSETPEPAPGTAPVDGPLAPTTELAPPPAVPVPGGLAPPPAEHAEIDDATSPMKMSAADTRDWFMGWGAFSVERRSNRDPATRRTS